MLDPRDRQLLLESLRPPEGYRLSGAIGTSYTLDLIALLTAPLAFTLHDWEDEEGGTITSPLALLESLRRHAEKITLFCQAGEIKVPPPTQRLVAYLEPCVVEVRAPHSEGVFHPKIWLLRYSSNDRPIRYRFLCLSRNLTFDKCWDTMLSLDGEVVERKNAISANRPLGDFIASLPGLAVRPITNDRSELVTRMAEEVRRVRFDLPGGVDEIAFWPMGFDKRARWPFEDTKRSLLAMSPFLSSSLLTELAEGRKECVLVSRPDELTTLTSSAVGSFSRIYTMDPAAEDLSADDSVSDAQPLAGLHAKLFVVDDGWNARVYTGSANATHAGFNRNVEFLVELRGKKANLGIEAFLGDGDNDRGFARMLSPWKGQLHELSEAERVRETLEEQLANMRRYLSTLQLSILCVPTDQQRFVLQLQSGTALSIDSKIHIRCWPSSLRSEDGKEPKTESGSIASFGPLSAEAITSFFAFELAATDSGVSVTSRFALALPIDGAPKDRLQKLLASQLKDKEHVLRFIWLLLEAEMSGTDTEELVNPTLEGSPSRRGSFDGYPIFERLVSCLSGSPDRARDVGRVIEDLLRTPEGRSLLPDGLESLWVELKAAIEECHVETA